MLTPNVQRRREHTACLPAHRLFASAARIPDHALAVAGKDVKHFFEKVSLRRRPGAHCQLTEVTSVDALAADQIYVSTANSRTQTVPRSHCRLAQIADVVIFVYRQVVFF